MLRKIIYCIILVATIGISCLDANHAITHVLEKDLETTILSYVQARYLSYATSIPFLYHQFDDQLILDHDALTYDQHSSKYSRQFHIRSKETFTEFLQQTRDPNLASTIFIIDYIPACISLWEQNDTWPSLLFNIPQQNEQFARYLQQRFRSKITIPSITRKDRLNVAVYVCTNDDEKALANFPLKYPNLDYYKNQIRRIYMWNSKQPMYVHLFSNNPIQSAQTLQNFRQSFRGNPIVFDTQSHEHAKDNTTLHNFFTMQNFDVLIATKSDYSIVASYLGSFDMVIYPVHFQGAHPNCWIDCVQAMSKKSSWFPYELNTILRDYQ